MLNSIGNTALVRYREVVRFSEGPLSEARLYYYYYHDYCYPVDLSNLDVIIPLSFQSGLTAYDVAKVSGHQSVCDELQRHSNEKTKTEITKVRVCLRCL